MSTMTKQQELDNIRKKYPALYPFAIGMAILLFGIWLGAILFDGDGGYATNLYTELISIGITVVVLDQINEYRTTQKLKQRLVREAGSFANNTAVSAVDWIRHEGWLKGEDGLLKSASLFGANLEGVNFSVANLQNANLETANLEHSRLIRTDLKGASMVRSKINHANLSVANLENTNLFFAELKGANLVFATLRGASLPDVNLDGARLDHADLSGANLSGASLKGASLFRANLTETDMRYTILPDGTKWTIDVDMECFTDRTHPKFEAIKQKINSIRINMGLDPILLEKSN